MQTAISFLLDHLIDISTFVYCIWPSLRFQSFLGIPPSILHGVHDDNARELLKLLICSFVSFGVL